MTDVVAKATRSRMMSGIRSRHTKPEKKIRSMLHVAGFRFRLHRQDLPGKPDIVLPKYKAAIFVNGCFWHCHKCHLFKWPKSNTAFWREKINANSRRDQANKFDLKLCGWRTLVLWECATKGNQKISDERLSKSVSNWLLSKSKTREIPSRDRKRRQ